MRLRLENEFCVDILPTPSASLINETYLYTGPSNNNFKHNLFYECKAKGTSPETYEWKEAEVSSISFNEILDRPERPTKQEIADIIYPIPNMINDNASVPTGIVATFFGLTAPAGWLVCDGAKYSKTDYPALFSHLSQFSSSIRSTWGDADWTDEFNVPNLQGEFPRFSGTNSHTNQGSGANVGEHQNGTVTIPFGANSESSGSYLSACISAQLWTGYENADFAYPTIANNGYVRVSVNSNKRTPKITSRPTNTSLLPIIKY